MKYCGNCGAALNEGAKFCGGCGCTVQGDQKAALSQGISAKSASITSQLDAVQIQAIAKTIFVCPPEQYEPLLALFTKWGASPIAVTTGISPDEIQTNAVNQVNRHVADGGLEHICILGNWEEVPPFYLPNPAYDGHDPDEYCLTDAPYGIIGGCASIIDGDILSYIPALSVGRLPTADVLLLERLLGSKPASKSASDALDIAVTAECWNEATNAIVGKITKGRRSIDHSDSPEDFFSKEGQLINSPDWDLDSLSQTITNQPFNNGSLLLFNVHGSDACTYWFGDDGRGGGGEIFHPSAASSFPDVVLMTEACYGGALGYEEPSMVEHFFSSGGRAFVGCSVVAYGTPDASLSGADIVALNFINGLEDGKSFAEALNFAKLEVSIADPECTDVSLKTVMSFNLYGLPWQRFSASRPHPSSLGATSSTADIRERLRGRLDTIRGRVSDGLSDRREAYRARVPEPLKRFVLNQENFLQELSQFRDYTKIQSMFADLHVEMNDCTLESQF